MSQQYEPRYNIIHRSLNEVKVVMGVPKKLFVINATAGAAIAYGIFPPILLITMVIHMYLKFICEDDKLKDVVLRQRAKQADWYDPWHRRVMKRNSRPEGCGKGMLK